MTATRVVRAGVFLVCAVDRPELSVDVDYISLERWQRQGGNTATICITRRPQ